MKKIFRILSLLMVFTILTGCTTISKKKAVKEKYNFLMYEAFDTQITLLAYAESKEVFDEKAKIFKEEFMKYHKLYDYYRTYEGINNIQTINEKAGIEPVKVDKEIIELLKESKDLYERGHRKTNVAMGSVFFLWHELREKYIEKGPLGVTSSNSEETEIPTMEELKKAEAISDINDMVIDEKESTVFLKKPGMRIDVGAFAKGYATEKVAKRMREEGLTEAIISAGGNIKIIGPPKTEDKHDWSVGIQNPNMRDDGEPTLDLLYLKTGSIVSSGDYERFYMYKGERMHHIIDPVTLMPGTNFRQVTIVTEDSAIADFFSTALYLMTYEEGLEVAKKENFEVIWVFKDKSIKTTEGIKKHLKSQGAKAAEE